MNPTTNPKADDRADSPIGILIAIFVACGVIGAVLALGYQSRMSSRLIVQMAADSPRLGNEWVANLQAGKYEAVREASTLEYGKTLTDPELDKIRNQVARIGDKPVASGWTMNGGGVRLNFFPPSFTSPPLDLTYHISIPNPDGTASSEDFTLRFVREEGRFKVAETAVKPRLTPQPVSAAKVSNNPK